MNANAPRQFAHVASGVRRVSQTCTNAMVAIANTIDGSRTLMQDLFVRIGVIAAVIPAPWKNCPSADPIVVQPNEVRSGVMLLKGMGEIDSTSVLKHVGAVLRDINGQFSRIWQIARVFSKYASNAGVSTVDAISLSTVDAISLSTVDAISLADDYAKQLDEAMSKDPTGGALLKKMRQTLGKSSVRDFIRNTVNQVESDHERNSMRVLRNVMDVFKNNSSTFGVSPYLYLSNEPIVNNTQGIYGDVFVGGEHPFRHLPSGLRSVSAHNLLCMSYDGVANLLNSPVCVRGHFTYDLAVSHEDYNPEFSLNTYPVTLAKDNNMGFIEFQHITLDACVTGRVEPSYNLLQSLRGPRRVYVSPRSDYFGLSRLWSMTVRFAGPDQEFSDSTLKPDSHYGTDIEGLRLD